jgi:uridine kinase
VGSPRERTIGAIADQLVRRPAPHPLRVAVDAITAAGKTTFAADLTAAISAPGRTAIHLSTDDFHHVAAVRHRHPDRARGYYADAYDLATFRRLVLEPLGPDGDRRYQARLHDLETGQVFDEAAQTAPADAIVVVDGTFLQSPVLAGGWDEVIWLDVAFGIALERAIPRDAAQFGSAQAVRDAYTTRYHPACRLYLAEVDPRAGASIVVADAELTG